MKVLYVANRWDPREQTEYSGNDYGAYHAIKDQPGVEMELVGPFIFPPELSERVFYKFRRFFKRRPIKHPDSYLKRSAKMVREAIIRFQPDVIFTKYCAPLVYLHTEVPLVYMCDSTIVWARDAAQEFTKAAYDRMERWEEKAICMASKVITFSQASADVISAVYEKAPEDIVVFPVPSQVPKNLLPSADELVKPLGDAINLLFVGKRYRLRGADVAIQVVEQLNAQGTPAELRIVGMTGNNTDHVSFKGRFHKEQAGAMQAYYDNFKWAHLLLHPARFHSAGIVISEAAGFGVPTITNNVGGLATTVKDGVTGLVLPANSPAESYVSSIQSLMADEVRYHAMQTATRLRFDEELHWDVAGRQVFECVRSAAGLQ